MLSCSKYLLCRVWHLKVREKFSWVEVGPAMEADLVDLEGLFQEDEDFQILACLWNLLEPRDRLCLLAVSWYLNTGFHRLLLLRAVQRGL